MKKLLLLLLPVLCGAEDLSNLNCSKEIRNVSFEASSFYQYSVGPHQANLRNQDGGGAWCPQSLIMKNSDTEEFLELVLEAEFLITSITTQGRFAGGLGLEFAEHVVIQYWKPGYQNFIQYKNRKGEHILPANTDTDTEVDIQIETPFVASKIRVLPFSFHSRTVCMRVGLKGCEYKEQSVKAVREEEGWRRKPDSVEPKEQLDNIARRKLAYDHHDEELDSNYLGIAVGALVSVIFILISIILFILYKNYTVSRDEDEIDLEPEGSWSKVYRTYGDKSLRYSPPTSEGNNTDSVGEYGSPFFSGYTQDRNQRYTGTIFSQESTSTNRSHLYNDRIYYPIGSQDTEYTTLELVSTKQNNTISDPKISATNPSYL